MARLDKKVMEERVRRVAQLIVEGMTPAEILHQVTLPIARGGEGWHLKARQVRNLRRLAMQAIRAAAHVDRELEVGRAVQRLEQLYARADATGDGKLCLSILREQSALLGLRYSDELDRRITELEEGLHHA